MILQDIYINKYNWNVRLLFNLSFKNLNIIEQELKNIQCPNDLIKDAVLNFKKDECNKGLTYSNYSSRQSLVIIGNASSKEQSLNTLIHELYHLTKQITILNNENEEELQAIFIGDFIMQLKDVLYKIIL